MMNKYIKNKSGSGISLFRGSGGLFLFLLFLTSGIHAQSLLQTKYYSVNDGLSQNRVLGSLQDDNGYIWVNTWNGLERFDGYSFQNFKTYPSDSMRMSNHRILTIKKSSLGNIWCLTHNDQLYLFDTHTETFEDIFHYNKNVRPRSIQAIFVLEDGITWALGSGDELYRIDEKKYKETEAIVLYENEKDSKQETIFYDIIKDSEGDEWLLTNKGITIVGNKTIHNRTSFQFFIETDQEIYLANDKGTFARYYTDGNILPYILDTPIATIGNTGTTSNGRIVIMRDNGIALFHPGPETFQYYYMEQAGQPLSPLYFFEDSKGNFWFVTNRKKVARIEAGTDRISYYSYTSEGEIQDQYPSEDFVHEDEYGCIWIKPHDGDFCFWDTKNDRLERAYTLNRNKKEYLTFQSFNHSIDTHNNLWYANNQGVNYISFSHKNYEYIMNPAGSEARSFMEDHNGRLWIGWRPGSTKQKSHVGIYDRDNNWLGNMTRSGKIVNNPDTGFGAYVYCIYEDDEKNIWFGTRQDGIFLLEPRGENEYKITQYLPNPTDPYSVSYNSVYAILQDSQKRIWAGTYGGGINLVEKDTIQNKLRFIHAGNILNNYPIHMCDRVRCLYETTDGVILVGTTEGLLSFPGSFDRPETLLFYHNKGNSLPSSLSNNDVLNICRNKEGKLFITSLSGGINITEENDLLSNQIRFSHFNKTNGLISDFTMSAIEDRNGIIWIASENSLTGFNPQTNTFENYNRHVLKTDFEISEATPLLRSNGQLLFGTIHGALCIAPDEITKSDFIPPIVFTRINIYQDGSYRQEPLFDKSKRIELSPTERNFTIAFAALDYSNANGIEYAYRMTGLTEQWIYVGGNRTATFTELPAGKYELQVMSTNGDGVWVENNDTLYIYVKPKFRETGWAILLYILLFLLLMILVAFVISYITNLRNKVDFEQKLTNLKLRFFTDISHELRTPLTLIANPIEEVISQENLSQDGVENMQVAKRNVNRMLQLINQILDFRKIQNSKMKVYIEYTDIILTINQVFENFKHIAQQKNICFNLVSEADEIRMYTDVDKLEKIVFNLLSNAFKYTPDHKSITLTVTADEQFLHISVKDEGKGFQISQANKLFQRFETNHSASGWGSTGIGLSLVNELLNLIHGTIRVESTPNKGSTFTIQLPQKYELYTADKNIEFILKDESTDITAGADLRIRATAGIGTDSEIRASEEIRTSETSILIVEDNDELRRFMCNILRKDYAIFEATNGKEGLELAIRETPDIIISDIMMPEMDGIDFLKHIKDNHDTSHIPVILLSAKASVDDRIQGLEYGADDYISKPFNSVYLKARIQSLIKQRKTLYDFYTNKALHSETVLPQEKGATVTPPPPLTGFDDEFIRKVIDSVEENMQNQDFRIDDLADSMAMSRTVFYRKLKSIVGLAPAEFVKDMRLKRAIEYLDTGKYTVSEVAYMAGFNTPQYFSKVFKDTMNCSPKEYKQNRKE